MFSSKRLPVSQCTLCYRYGIESHTPRFPGQVYLDLTVMCHPGVAIKADERC